MLVAIQCVLVAQLLSLNAASQRLSSKWLDVGHQMLFWYTSEKALSSSRHSCILLISIIDAFFPLIFLSCFFPFNPNLQLLFILLLFPPFSLLPIIRSLPFLLFSCKKKKKNTRPFRISFSLLSYLLSPHDRLHLHLTKKKKKKSYSLYLFRDN